MLHTVFVVTEKSVARCALNRINICLQHGNATEEAS